MQFFDVSDLELIVPGTAKNFQILKKGAMLVRGIDIIVDPENPANVTYKNVMQIEKRKLTFDIEDGWILTVGGPGLKKILFFKDYSCSLTLIHSSESCFLRTSLSWNISSFS